MHVVTSMPQRCEKRAIALAPPCQAGSIPAIPHERQTTVSRTSIEYAQRWRDAMDPSNPPTTSVAPWDERLTPTSAILFESSRAQAQAETCAIFADFGDAICYYRYLRVPQELEMTPSVSACAAAASVRNASAKLVRWADDYAQFSSEEIRRRLFEGTHALAKLLERFVYEGYQPEMGQRLIEIVSETLIEFELHTLYVLPGDLQPLLASIGNPLITCDLGQDEPDAHTQASGFDLNTPGHRELLEDLLVPPTR